MNETVDELLAQEIHKAREEVVKLRRHGLGYKQISKSLRMPHGSLNAYLGKIKFSGLGAVDEYIKENLDPDFKPSRKARIKTPEAPRPTVIQAGQSKVEVQIEEGKVLITITI